MTKADKDVKETTAATDDKAAEVQVDATTKPTEEPQLSITGTPLVEVVSKDGKLVPHHIVGDNLTPVAKPIKASKDKPTTEVVAPTKRVFQVGPTRIVESPTMVGKSNEDCRGILMSMYPEIKDATITEQVQGDTTLVYFKPKAGRKG